MTLIIDNPTVEKMLNPSEVNDALELAALELATGGAINSPPYRVFTPRDPDDYRDHPRFPEGGGNPTHHSFTSLSGAIAKLDATTDRIDSDIITYFEQDGRTLQRRVPGRKDGKFCGLIYLYSSRTGELLAIIHDGYLQKFRVAGTGAVGAKIPGPQGFAHGGPDRNGLAGPGRRSLFRCPRQLEQDQGVQPDTGQERIVCGPDVQGGRDRNRTGSLSPRGGSGTRTLSTWRPTPRTRW